VATRGGTCSKRGPGERAAGVVCLIREGDAIIKGHRCSNSTPTMRRISTGRDAIANAVVVGERPVNTEALLLERITN